MVRACASGAVDLGLIPSRVKPMTLTFGIHSFSASCSALKRQCGEQAGKFTCRVVGKGTSLDSPILRCIYRTHVFWVAIFASVVSSLFLFFKQLFTEHAINERDNSRYLSSRIFNLVKIKNCTYHVKMHSFEKILTAQLLKWVEHLLLELLSLGSITNRVSTKTN